MRSLVFQEIELDNFFFYLKILTFPWSSSSYRGTTVSRFLHLTDIISVAEPGVITNCRRLFRPRLAFFFSSSFFFATSASSPRREFYFPVAVDCSSTVIVFKKRLFLFRDDRYRLFKGRFRPRVLVVQPSSAAKLWLAQLPRVHRILRRNSRCIFTNLTTETQSK